jgi:drug/metabolite transporter (DMT)-like permease
MLFALVTACGLGAITTQAKIFYVRRGSFRVDKQQRIPLILLGIIWSGAMISYLVAVETISVSLAVLILYFYPLLVLAYSVIKRQLKASAAVIALFCAAFFGLYLALSGGEITIDLNGILFAALASCGAAFTFICGARVAPSMSPLLMTFWINAIGLLMILPMMAGKLALPAAGSGGLALGLATVFYLVAILSQFEALARLTAARAAFLLNLEPVVSILLAVLVLNETLSIIQASGVILVISVVILSLRFKPAEA